jgi:hypothetical protein
MSSHLLSILPDGNHDVVVDGADGRSHDVVNSRPVNKVVQAVDGRLVDVPFVFSDFFFLADRFICCRQASIIST